MKAGCSPTAAMNFSYTYSPYLWFSYYLLLYEHQELFVELVVEFINADPVEGDAIG